MPASGPWLSVRCVTHLYIQNAIQQKSLNRQKIKKREEIKTFFIHILLILKIVVLKYGKPFMLSVKQFTFNPVEENTFVLYNGAGECCIIDPGCYFPQEKDELKSFIEKKGLHPVLLLNTHCHLDHVFGNKWVAETWGLTLHIHEKEKVMLDFAPQTGEMWQMPFENYKGELIYLREGTTIKLGDEELEIRFTPGHSPGSVCFYHEPGGFAISGDVLFNGSIGRTDLPGGDFKTLIDSIQTQLFTLPDETKIFAGHGPVTTVGFEKMNNAFVKIY
jgi:glyoxylase-like metal-dependent hydrolase (beta-lactamase superfamily II)